MFRNNREFLGEMSNYYFILLLFRKRVKKVVATKEPKRG
jgi:hypothetical protein